MSVTFARIAIIAGLVLVAGCEGLMNKKISSDESMIDLAREELNLIRNGLAMYQAENDTSAYPRSADIISHQRLLDAMAGYVDLPATPRESAFSYVSYISPAPDTFVLMVKARDDDRTAICATPDGLYLRVGRESVPLPPR